MSHPRNLTTALYNEACRLMALGYSPRHAAYVVNVPASQLAKAATGDEDGIEALERQCREARIARIKRHIEEYPGTSMFSTMEQVA